MNALLFLLFPWLIATCTAEPLGVALNGVPLRGPKDSDWEVDALGSRPGTRTCGTPSQFDDVGTAVDGSRSSCSILGPADGILYCGDGLAASAPSIDKCGGTTDSKGRSVDSCSTHGTLKTTQI